MEAYSYGWIGMNTYVHICNCCTKPQGDGFEILGLIIAKTTTNFAS